MSHNHTAFIRRLAGYALQSLNAIKIEFFNLTGLVASASNARDYCYGYGMPTAFWSGGVDYRRKDSWFAVFRAALWDN